MATTPNIPGPDRIDPQAPAEVPAAPSPEKPAAEPPELVPLPPETEQPGIHPGEWPSLDLLLMPFVGWTLLLDNRRLPRAPGARRTSHRDLPIPEPIEASGEHALFA